MRNGGERRSVRLRTLTLAPLVAAALAFGVVGPARASNDPLFDKQWNLNQIGAAAVWGRSTGAGVRIGIVDTGVHLSQEDLAGKVVAQTSCIGSGGNPAACSGSGQDDNGHGTHVSGIAAAYKDNGRGIAGVAPDAQLVVAKALDSNGDGDSADVAAGIAWVVQHGARVVNLSLGESGLAGTLFTDSTFTDAVNAAYAAGAVPVVASGNSRFLIFGGSANSGNLNAVVVGATQPGGSPASYSSAIGSAKWGVMAPGGAGSGDANDVISTYWNPNDPSSTNSYAYLAGTSMATPHVSGLVALLLAEGLPRDAAIQQVLTTSAAIPGCAASTCGHGLINLPAAVGTGGGGGPTGGTGTTGSSGSSNGGAGTHIVKTPATTTPRAAATTQLSPPGSDTTAVPAVTEPEPSGGPLVAAGQLHGNTHGGTSGRPSSRALQVGAAIALLGGAGLGLGMLLRLRGGAAP